MSAKNNNDGCGCMFLLFGVPFLVLSLVISGFSLFGQVRTDPSVDSCGSLAQWFVGRAYNSAACQHGMHIRLFLFFCATPVGMAIIIGLVVALFGGMVGNGPDASGTIRSGGSTWSWKAWFK